MTSQEIRQKFLQFFESKGHTIVPSAPMVIKGDPTLMFTNAGMNQFKEYFLGHSKSPMKRATDTQKCLRVSGKHNDLEEVGRDTYHHTMFEMLGNWSFGDYFKKEAITWAWELLTEVYGIPKENLYVTVFEGSEQDGVPFDQEAFDIWKGLVPEERILFGNKKDNFWEMGDQGPCGPCTEIHVDIRSAEDKKKVAGRELVNKDHPQVIEIWNNVFMEFNRKADGSLEKLPAQHVDTGMGFERLCMVLQGKQSNYDTDVFTPLIHKIEEITGTQYSNGTDLTEGQEAVNIAIRVIADHVRAVSFAIADGQLPSNNGAGYVIRRILRRAIRYGFTFLGQKEPFIYKLLPTLVAQMGSTFPEIEKYQLLIENVIREEENSFLHTLEQGLLMLDVMIQNTTDKVLSGGKAFELYDTYGFPIDLTALILSEKGLTLDEAGFEEHLQKQKERSRAAAQVKTDDWVVLRDDDEEEFIGYDTLEAVVRLVKYRKVESQKDGTYYQLVFNTTPFYPEGGGQVGDKGTLTDASGTITYILDTKRENNLIVHLSETLPDNLTDPFQAQVHPAARALAAANHSATHLLHQALREVLGTHVEQKGSKVDGQSLRFDFSHFAKLTDEQLAEVERRVNERIMQKIPLQEHRNIPIQQAVEQGAMALFGEKYGDKVRMIQFGESRELCGGTHVKNTGDIWYFKIVSEGAVAAGIRRIEAITALAALEHFKQQEKQLAAVKHTLKNAQDPVKAVSHLQQENARLLKEIEELKHAQALQKKGELKAAFKEVNGVQLLTQKLDMDMATLKDLAFALGAEVPNAFILFGAEQEGGKALLLCYINKELAAAKGLDAGKVVRELGKYIQGGGGGQPFFATAGGKKPEGIAEALDKVVEFI
ncbi:alanyl-tRNA synthetase [Capnocytophaga haemolytica]|uniref:Alanine--tRNA ligase n=1 Tax=Capnocytophaga haemolytica TaxID=45243 RepID=A0AAX2H3I1_9FLAO|nr:alanine--tRNA ligase [Capnocytophaga haemolytica]AMD85692.1 alanine--tRNA ligase [Capnocytophaga haemolytica]SFN90816.1 alanyl-tRNA synthetase [Capnocytophaga haemolytica]SNV16381.1 Alanine--tRNA ligase [Capnocytophaga haemolytica]